MSKGRILGAGIYHDSGTNPWQVSEFHFNQLGGHGYNFEQSTYYYQESVEDFISSNHSLKFAGYHVSFPAVDSWIERFHRVYPHVAHSFIFCSELHQVTVDQINTLDLPNVTIFIAGNFNYELKHARVSTWMDWFHTSPYFYKHIKPALLDEKLICTEKSKYFDILLGCQRTHRDFVYNYITQNSLDPKVIMTYHQRWNQDLRESTQYICEDEGVEYIEAPNHTVHQVKYYGYNMTLSQVIPLSIYNQTYYSLVAETNAVNQFNFYTEKIVKPILGKRLFVVIAGQHYLKNLRSFGFRTFDNIIDESYDNEPNNELRWLKALEQVRYLCYKNTAEVLVKIKDVVEHNQRLMLEHDWYNNFNCTLAAELDPYLTPAHTVAG